MPTSKPKFVEGTVHQLARVLYEVHSENESQPTVAIQEALRMFGDDLDRNTILQDAKISAEALVLKRTILLSTQTSQPTMTVFEQAEKIKQGHISHYKLIWMRLSQRRRRAHQRRKEDHQITKI